MAWLSKCCMWFFNVVIAVRREYANPANRLRILQDKMVREKWYEWSVSVASVRGPAAYDVILAHRIVDLICQGLENGFCFLQLVVTEQPVG